jgi:hypothetical protein
VRVGLSTVIAILLANGQGKSTTGTSHLRNPESNFSDLKNGAPKIIFAGMMLYSAYTPLILQ